MFKVTFFQRRPRPGFNFSFEAIFDQVRAQLSDKIAAEVKICSYFNDGWWTKILNIIEAALRQSKTVNHITGEVHFLNLLMRKKTVLLTIHDCRFMERKKGLQQLFVKWLYLDMPVRKARYVTTVSENTKQDILKYTSCRPEKIKVVPVAVDKMYQAFPKPFNAEKPVILQVGTGENKNLLRLIEAVASIPCHLSIVGKLSDQQKAALEQHNLEYSNAYNLSAEEILARYQHCDLLAFVSTFEGFGMPIIEANSVERVVLTSNISSMPEVAGEAALLVDPFDVTAIRKGILTIIQDASLRRRLIEAGRKNRLRFQPQAIARQYFELYKKLANKEKTE
jgi:glycosyltransferase involved in cell wall biosynthesis